MPRLLALSLVLVLATAGCANLAGKVLVDRKLNSSPIRYENQDPHVRVVIRHMDHRSPFGQHRVVIENLEDEFYEVGDMWVVTEGDEGPGIEIRAIPPGSVDSFQKTMGPGEYVVLDTFVPDPEGLPPLRTPVFLRFELIQILPDQSVVKTVDVPARFGKLAEVNREN